VAKKVGGTLVKQWLYRDSLSPVAELDGTGAVVSRFVYVSRPNIPDFVIRGTKTYRLLSDHLGSPRMAVNVADVNDVPFRADYTAFGVQTMLNGTAADWIPFGFAGGLADPEMGLIRFGARDYESGSGRWMQRDPIRFAGGANLYAYAMNDPVNFIDRTGHQPIPIPWWGPIAGGAAAGAAAGSAVGGVGAIPGALAGAALMCLMLTSDTPEEPPEICQLQYEWGNECVYICPESGTVIKTRRHGGPSTLNPANDVCPRTIIYG
jgi:RHS repeat-associated protein